MGKRLKGFDYSRPYFYMVTLSRSKGWEPFSHIIGDAQQHFLQKLPITRAFTAEILTFHKQWQCIEQIRTFTIMPDHIHLLIRIRPNDSHITLSTLVHLLMRRLEQVYLEIHHPPIDSTSQHLFSPDWHDWIILNHSHLKAFTRYIRENPMRRWRRITHREHFGEVQKASFCGHQWFAYGNPELLNLPIIEGFQCSRKWSPTDKEWADALSRATRLGPGCAGVSTFMSPCEKICGNQIYKAGGSMVILHPEGFPERWHPSRNKETLCAQGRLLFLSLYPASTRKLTTAELHDRCHTMGNLVAGGCRRQHGSDGCDITL